MVEADRVSEVVVIHGSFIVSGASSGIGMAIYNRLASRFEPGRTVKIDVKATPPTDTRNYAAVDAIVAPAVEGGGVHHLVCSAGVLFIADPTTGRAADFIGADPTTLKSMIDINLTGTVNVLHAFLKATQKRREPARVVVISSISSFFSGGPNMAVYDSTKAALTALVKRLAGYRGVNINSISPGSVRTAIGAWTPDFAADDAGRKLVQAGQDSDKRRLGSEVTTEQIAAAAEHLLFQDHGMNGSDLIIDGGLTLLGRDGY